MQTALAREWIDKSQAGENICKLHVIQKSLITKYIKDSYHAIIRQKPQFLKWARYLNRHCGKKKYTEIKINTWKVKEMQIQTKCDTMTHILEWLKRVSTYICTHMHM